MYKKIMGTVIGKFTLVIMLGYVVVSAIFMYLFTMIHTSELAKEQEIDRIKAERLLSLVNDNTVIREKLKEYLDRDVKNAIENRLYTQDASGNYIFPTDKVDPKVFEMVSRTDINPIRESLIIERDAIKIRQSAFEKSCQLVLWSGIVLFVALILLRLAVKFFVANPVENIVAVSEKFAAGDLTARIPVKALSSTPDELTRLGWAFNRMAMSLEKSLLDIRRKEHFQQALIDAIPDGIRVIDEDFNIVVANRAYRELVGIAEDKGQDIGKCYFSSHKRESPCQKNMVTCPLTELSAQKTVIKAVQRFKNHTENDLPVEVNAAVLKRDEYQKGDLVVESIRDLTQDIRFSHTQKLSSVGMLAAGVAHELRNPLGSIRLILEGLVSKIENKKIDISEIEKYLRKITDQIVNCASVTEILLKLSRLPSDELENVDVKQAIAEINTLLDYEAKKRGVTVCTSVAEGDLYIKATESEIRMVLLNLLQNAFNAMPKGGRVEVTAAKEKGRVIIYVKDEGVGISEENLVKIFDPFFSTRAGKNGKGTGIGLTIAKSMIERYKGSIAVQSRKNQGTVFELNFPEADKENA